MECLYLSRLVFFILFGCINRIEIAGTCGSFIFSFCGNPILFFIMAVPIYTPVNTNLYSHQQWIRVPFSPPPHNTCYLSPWEWTFKGLWKPRKNSALQSRTPYRWHSGDISTNTRDTKIMVEPYVESNKIKQMNE